MSSNPYIVVGKLQVRRGLEYQLPGRPISTDPFRFSETLDSGEFGLTLDSQRLFIGPSPAGTNALNDSNREMLFPYMNVEVLTESSPRNKELFGQFWRDQDASDFFFGMQPVAALTLSGLKLGPQSFSDFVNTEGARIDGAIMSGAVDYIVFFPTSGSIKQGTFFYQADASKQTIADNNPTVFGNDANISFQISPQRSDASGAYYVIQASNTSSETAQVYLRRRFISVGEGGGVAETIAFVGLGKLGYTITGYSGQEASLQTQAVDNLNYAITYSTPTLPGTLTINPQTGLISGLMPVDTSGEFLTSTVTATSTTGLSTTANLNITVEAISQNPWYFSFDGGAGLSVQAGGNGQPPYTTPGQAAGYPTYLLAGLREVTCYTSGIPAYPFRVYLSKNSQQPFCYYDFDGETIPSPSVTTTQDIEFDAGDTVTVSVTADFSTAVNGWVTGSGNIVQGGTPPPAAAGAYVPVNLHVSLQTDPTPTGNGVVVTTTPITITPEAGPHP